MKQLGYLIKLIHDDYTEDVFYSYSAPMIFNDNIKYTNRYGNIFTSHFEKIRYIQIFLFDNVEKVCEVFL